MNNIWHLKSRNSCKCIIWKYGDKLTDDIVEIVENDASGGQDWGYAREGTRISYFLLYALCSVI